MSLSQDVGIGGDDEKCELASKAVSLQMHRFYLDLLNIRKTQTQFTHFLREGNFQSYQAVRFLTEFKKNERFRLIELSKEAYIYMLRALL